MLYTRYTVSENMKNRYALISVYDKNGIIEFAHYLHKAGYKIISTGGTAKVLLENSIPVIPVQEITGNPESFDGRMKTISFQIGSGILFDRSKKSHLLEAEKLHTPSIDIVVCNLYPFEQTIQKACYLRSFSLIKLFKLILFRKASSAK